MTQDNEFMKRKMHFTLGLLGALFALNPFYPTFDKINFLYMGATIPLSYALMSIGVCLAAATYFFSAGMTEEHPSNLGQRLGNTFYGLAVMTVPFYCGMYVTTLLEKYIVLHQWISDTQMHAPLITGGILGFWGLLWLGASFLVRRYLTQHDWTYKMDGLIDKEMHALSRAKEMMDAHHNDLAVLQLYKAVLSRIKLLCLKNGVWYGRGDNAMQKAIKAGLIQKTDPLKLLIQAEAVARSTKPVGDAQAASAWRATGVFLSTTAV